MTYEPVIGLEIHVQLKTKSKMFCACPNSEEADFPNQFICPICTGQPGILPTINFQALKYSVWVALALNCQILEEAQFARKNYFYPDLPKGYQISMYDRPIGQNGRIILSNPYAKNQERKTMDIGITRVHLEEDAAKLIHDEVSQKTLVDFNRAGVPLLEIVTQPDFVSPEEAKFFLQELRRIVRYMGVSDGDMEKGHLRCDANVSLRPVIEGQEKGEPPIKFYPKTEIKNLNSFKAVEKALSYEIQRQKKLWEKGEIPNRSETRGFDEQKGETYVLRSKEESKDYRYFPEPDLPVIDLHDLSEKIVFEIPELPEARRARFRQEFFVSQAESFILTEEKYIADFYERAILELKAWLRSNYGLSEEEIEENPLVPKSFKTLTNWFINKLFGLLEKHSIDFRLIKITPENFAEFISLLLEGKLSGPAALSVLEEMLLTGGDPSQILETKKIKQIDQEDELILLAQSVLEKNEAAVKDYLSGKKGALQYLIGQVMKETRGQANPQMVQKILETMLKRFTAQ